MDRHNHFRVLTPADVQANRKNFLQVLDADKGEMYFIGPLTHEECELETAALRKDGLFVDRISTSVHFLHKLSEKGVKNAMDHNRTTSSSA